jgi:purine nucleosidase
MLRAPAKGMLMVVKILLDTDIGSDIDDAVCLAYLLAQPACELLGITTVTGEPTRRAMLAILPGAAEPLTVPPRQPHAPQADALSRWPHASADKFPQGEAIEFMRTTIRQHPGEVVLLTIGPLTNAALLFRADPSIPSLLRGLVSMGGSFAERPDADPMDWNIQLDPHAAAIVYRTPVPVHRSVGLDVTQNVKLSADEVRQRFRAPLLQPVLDFAEPQLRKRGSLTFHDPLAAAVIFNDQICTFHPGVVDVDLTPGPRFAKTTFTEGAPGNQHEVALGVDSAHFFEHSFSVLDSASG